MNVTMQDIMVVFESVPGLPVVTTNKAHAIAKALNTRAAQKVAAVDLQDPETECPYWTDSIQRHAWIQGANKYRDAVEPLVAGLRAEVERLKAAIDHGESKARLNLYLGIAGQMLADPGYERSGFDWDYEHPIHYAIDTLRTQNAELVGLLRECSEDLPGLAIAADGHRTWEGMVADKDPTVDLCSRIEAALSAYEGREGE